MEQLPATSVPEEIAGVLAQVTPQMQKFAEFYALHDNALKAWVLAGYTPNTGAPYRLRDDPRIQTLVTYYRAVYAEASLYTPAKIVRQWASMASFDLTALLNDDWSIKSLNDLPEAVRHHLALALVGIDVTEKPNTRTIKPRFAKTEALEHLGRLLKLYEQDKQSGEGLTIQITVQSSQDPQLFQEGVDIGPVQIRVHEGLPDDG